MNPESITVYGSLTCEDTALVRDRLRALGIPFADHNREDDPRINDMLARWNHGNLVTPTLVFGEQPSADQIVSEPTLEQLEERLRAAGYTFQSPRAFEIRDERKYRRAPDFTLPASDGRTVSIYKLPGHKRAVIFFAHAHDCRVCQGYARQFTQPRAVYDELNAMPLIILPDDLDIARPWAHEFARGYPVLVDVGRHVRNRYLGYFDSNHTNVLLAILDTYAAPRAISVAADAGRLIAPSEVAAWLRLLDCQCDE